MGRRATSTLWSVSNLANLFLNRKNYEGAQLLHRRALEGREIVLGMEHPDTLRSVNNMGNVLITKGDYQGAEVFYRRALEGSGHPFQTLAWTQKPWRALIRKGGQGIASGLTRDACRS